MKALRWIAVVPAVLLLATAAPHSVSAKVNETINQVYDTNSHPTLSLKNVNGGLVIEGWDQNRIEVTAVKTGRNQEILDELKVNCSMNNNHLRIEVKYDFDNDWDHNGNGNNAAVDFNIKVPRGTELSEVALVNGGIDVSNIEGDTEVASVNGHVAGKALGGNVILTTVNGGVELDASTGIESITMHSVNGSVRLMLPKKFDARIDASTVHGYITTEGVDVETTKFSGTSMRGTIGKGTLRVDLNTVNGSIKIRRDGESNQAD